MAKKKKKDEGLTGNQKKMGIGAGMMLGGTAAGWGAENLGAKASKAYSNSIAHELYARENLDDAKSLNEGAKTMYARGYPAVGDHLAARSVKWQGAGMRAMGRAERWADAGKKLELGSKVMKGVGIAGMAAGLATAGLGIASEMKAGMDDVKARKKRIRDARK